MYKARLESKLRKIKDWSEFIAEDEVLFKIDKAIEQLSKNGLADDVDSLLEGVSFIVANRYFLDKKLADAEKDLRVKEAVYEEVKAISVASQPTEKITEARNSAKIEMAEYDDDILEARFKRDIYKNAVETCKSLIDIMRSAISYYKQEMTDKNL